MQSSSQDKKKEEKKEMKVPTNTIGAAADTLDSVTDATKNVLTAPAAVAHKIKSQEMDLLERQANTELIQAKTGQVHASKRPSE